MKHFGIAFLAAIVATASPVMAQQMPEIAQGWRKVDGAVPAYVNAATLMRCPETLSDGYVIVSTQVYQSSTDVSCAYRLAKDNSVISFYFYPASGTAQEELTASSRVLLARLAPGVTPKEGQRAWTIGGAATSVSSLELTDAAGYNQSFAMSDVAGRRMKARETWSGDAAVSHRVADGFFALQQDAITNARTCAALPTWSATRKSRLSSDPLAAIMSASVVLPMLLKISDGADRSQRVKPCILASVGKSASGANVLLQRNGETTVEIVLDDQPAGHILAGSASIEAVAQLGLPGDASYVLYGHNGLKTSIYRAYKTQPNWEQIRSDMVLVATDALAPLVVVVPKVGEEGANVTINTNEIDNEKAKRRQGSR